MADTTTPTPGGAGTTPGNDMSQFLGWLASAFNLTSGNNNSNTQQAVNLADPNAKYQSGYADLLNTALTKPGSYDMTPGAQFAKEQGLEAVARHGNSMFGTTASGGTAIELEKYATGFAEQNYNTYIEQLTKLTQGSPDAAKLLLQGKNQGNSQIGTLMAGLGSILQAAGLNPQTIAQIMKQLGGSDPTNPNGYTTVGGEVPGNPNGSGIPDNTDPGGQETGGFPDLTDPGTGGSNPFDPGDISNFFG